MSATKEDRLDWYDSEIAKSQKRYRSNDGDMTDRWKTDQLKQEREKERGK